MVQTENTAIVLRHANYRDNDRMVTLLSPSRGRIDAIIRNCRKPKSHNLNAGELFALGDYMLYESGGHVTVTSVRLIETFYPLRSDYDRLACGVYLLNLTEAVAEPEQEQQELFMLLLHTLSRLTFSAQQWQPLLAGFLLHFSACQGFKPRLNHCVHCGKALPAAGPFFFDSEAGGVCCPDCRPHPAQTGAGGRTSFQEPLYDPAKKNLQPLSREQLAWMRAALTTGSASWVNSPSSYAPFSLLRDYVERRLGRRFKSGSQLPPP